MDSVLIAHVRKQAEVDAARLYLPNRDLFMTGLPNFKRFYTRDTLWFFHQILSLTDDDPFRLTHLTSIRSGLEFIASHQAMTPNTLRDVPFWRWPKYAWHRLGRDAEFGEMPHEIPRDFTDWLWLKTHFGLGFLRGHPYYGSVDATPLWLITLCAYIQESGDVTFGSKVRDNVSYALSWIEQKLEDGDGLVFYDNRSPWNPWHHAHHGWRDRSGSGGLDELEIAHPIALLDVQSLVYRALIDVAHSHRLLGVTKERADSLCRLATDIRRRVFHNYWNDEGKQFAFALHGTNRTPVAVNTIEQVFPAWCGLLVQREDDGPQIRRSISTAKRTLNVKLLNGGLWTDFGPRTLSVDEEVFDGTSYHLGSSWPWLSWLCVDALTRSGQLKPAERVREATLRGFVWLNCGHEMSEELFFIDREGNPSRLSSKRFRTTTSAAPQLWTVGAALSLAAK